jgi:hypothetical protein
MRDQACYLFHLVPSISAAVPRQSRPAQSSNHLFDEGGNGHRSVLWAWLENVALWSSCCPSCSIASPRNVLVRGKCPRQSISKTKRERGERNVVESAMRTMVAGHGKLARQAKRGETDCSRKWNLSRVRAQVGRSEKEMKMARSSSTLRYPAAFSICKWTHKDNPGPKAVERIY